MTTKEISGEVSPISQMANSLQADSINQFSTLFDGSSILNDQFDKKRLNQKGKSQEEVDSAAMMEFKKYLVERQVIVLITKLYQFCNKMMASGGGDTAIVQEFLVTYPGETDDTVVGC